MIQFTFKQVSQINVPHILAMAVVATAFAIAFSVIQLLTVLVSLFRLAFRLKIRRFWWEDVWAAVAMVVTVAYATVVLTCIQTTGSETVEIPTWIPFLFTSVVWSVRMSLLYSIIRIILPSTCLRNFARATSALFVIIWIVISVLKVWSCVRSQNFALEEPACYMSSPIAIFQVTADFAGDAILVILSLGLLWRVKLPRRQRRMILSIFSCSAVMSMISLPRAIAEVAYDENAQNILADFELILSSVVCNLLVIVTYIYRVYFKLSSSSESESSSEDDDFTTPVPRSTQSLTTVDLNTSDPTTTGATNYFGGGSSPSPISS